jgi:hypothetical protein
MTIEEDNNNNLQKSLKLFHKEIMILENIYRKIYLENIPFCIIFQITGYAVLFYIAVKTLIQ